MGGRRDEVKQDGGASERLGIEGQWVKGWRDEEMKEGWSVEKGGE